MASERQRRIALVLCLFWAAAAAAAYFACKAYGKDLNLILVLVSLFLLAVGLVTLFGRIRFFFPFCFMSEKDLTEYNVTKIGSFLGIPTAVLSCIFPFVSVSFLVFGIVLAIAIPLECGGLYTCAANKFKADVQNTKL